MWIAFGIAVGGLFLVSFSTLLAGLALAAGKKMPTRPREVAAPVESCDVDSVDSPARRDLARGHRLHAPSPHHDDEPEPLSRF